MPRTSGSSWEPAQDEIRPPADHDHMNDDDLIAPAVADAMTGARARIAHLQAAAGNQIPPAADQLGTDVSMEPEEEEDIMEAAEDEEIRPARDELQGGAASCAAVSASCSGTGVTDPLALPLKLAEMESAVAAVTVPRLQPPIADPAAQEPVLSKAPAPTPPLAPMSVPTFINRAMLSPDTARTSQSENLCRPYVTATSQTYAGLAT